MAKTKTQVFSEMIKPCPHCDGTGKVSDSSVIGKYFRGMRLRSGVSLRQVANQLNFSASHISDLEHGKRAWNSCLIYDFLKAIKSSPGGYKRQKNET